MEKASVTPKFKPLFDGVHGELMNAMREKSVSLEFVNETRMDEYEMSLTVKTEHYITKIGYIPMGGTIQSARMEGIVPYMSPEREVDLHRISGCQLKSLKDILWETFSVLIEYAEDSIKKSRPTFSKKHCFFYEGFYFAISMNGRNENNMNDDQFELQKEFTKKFSNEQLVKAFENFNDSILDQNIGSVDWFYRKLYILANEMKNRLESS